MAKVLRKISFHDSVVRDTPTPEMGVYAPPRVLPPYLQWSDDLLWGSEGTLKATAMYLDRDPDSVRCAD